MSTGCGRLDPRRVRRRRREQLCGASRVETGVNDHLKVKCFEHAGVEDRHHRPPARNPPTPIPTVGAVYDCTTTARLSPLQFRNAGTSMTRRCGMRRRSRFLHFQAIANILMGFRREESETPSTLGRISLRPRRAPGGRRRCTSDCRTKVRFLLLHQGALFTAAPRCAMTVRRGARPRLIRREERAATRPAQGTRRRTRHWRMNPAL